MKNEIKKPKLSTNSRTLQSTNSRTLQIVDPFLSFSKLGSFVLYVEIKIPSLGNKIPCLRNEIPSLGIDAFISGVCYLMVLRGL